MLTSPPNPLSKKFGEGEKNAIVNKTA
jgi:hypothetical protein